MVFDVFKTWRLDSGDYKQMAEVVVSAWERRSQQLQQSGGPQGIPQQRPALMHSNLSDVSECLEVAKWVSCMIASCCDVCWAVLCCAVLYCAVLCCALRPVLFLTGCPQKMLHQSCQLTC